MKHTKCKECELREGDCGHHFKMDGITDYDIPSQSACDQYDNCMFFQADLKDKYKIACNVLLDLEQLVRRSDGWEDSAVEAVHNAVQTAIKCIHEKPQNEWIETSEKNPKRSGFYITTCEDICCRNIRVCGYDAVQKKWSRGGVVAWMPLPEPYKEGDEE